MVGIIDVLTKINTVHADQQMFLPCMLNDLVRASAMSIPYGKQGIGIFHHAAVANDASTAAILFPIRHVAHHFD